MLHDSATFQFLPFFLFMPILSFFWGGGWPVKMQSMKDSPCHVRHDAKSAVI